MKSTNTTPRRVPRGLALLRLAVAFSFLLLLCVGCVSSRPGVSTLGGWSVSPRGSGPPPDTEIRQQQIDGLINVVANLETDLEAALVKFAVQIGGGGDSIQSWLWVIPACLSWLVYPLVWRPIRKKRNGGDKPRDQPRDQPV